MTIEEWQKHIANVSAKAEQLATHAIAWVEDYRERGLRDLFACLAMQAIVGAEQSAWLKGKQPSLNGEKTVAEHAYAYADAMLEARKQPDRDPDDCAPCLDHGQSPDRGEGPVDK